MIKRLKRAMQIGFVASLVLLYLAGSRYMSERDFSRAAVQSKAEIVDLQNGRASVVFRDKKKSEHFAEIPQRKIADEFQEIGQHVAVQYLPDAPADTVRAISSRPFWLMSVIFLAAGIASFAGAISLRRHIAQREWDAARIFQGTKIVSNVEQIDRVKGTQDNPRWVITTSWMDQRTLQTRTFHSPPLKLDDEILDEIRHVRVWIHPDDPEQYEMDLRGIAKRVKKNATDHEAS